MILDILHKRLLIANSTTQVLPEKICAYCGSDATKDSLHIGHLLPLNILRILKKHDHKTIMLLGSATTLIGDPSWKTESRPMLSLAEVQHNLKCLTKQIQKLVDPDHIVYNHEWLEKFNIIEFIRDVGSLFSINQLVKLETFATRLSENRNLSFLEFTYPLLQGYDFLHLNRKYDCNVQIGGSDQWGNIVQGLHLLHKVHPEKKVYGITNELLTTSSGEKMGKSLGGAVFLDPALVSPYDFWQFWRNVDDVDVKKLMLQLTDIDIDVIESMELNTVEQINNAKKMLADNITTWVHSAQEAQEARAKSEEIFENDNVMDVVYIQSQSICDVLKSLNFAPSSKQAKQYIASGTVKIDNEKIIDHTHMLSEGSYVLHFAKKRRIKLEVSK